MSWEPLHGGDPFPSDHERMRTYGDAVTATGDLIEEQVRLLRLVAQEDRWVTETADAFRERATDTADRISETTGRYVRVGAAITTLADQLEEHERQARLKVTAAREAEARVAANPVAEPEPGEDGSAGELTEGQRAQNSRRESAQGDLDRLQREFDAILAAAEDDGRTCQRTIDDAKDDDVKDSWLERNAGWLGAVASALGVIAAIAGLVFITIATAGTVWLVVAVVAGVAALLINLSLALGADGSWTAVALDAISLLTLGTGGPLIRGARLLFAGTRSAAASAVASRTFDVLTDGSRLFRGLRSVAGLRIPLVSRLAGAGQEALTNRATARAIAAGRELLTTPVTTWQTRVVVGGQDAAEIYGRTQQALRTLRGAGEYADVSADLWAVQRRLLAAQGLSAIGVGAGVTATGITVATYGPRVVDRVQDLVTGR